MDKPKPYQNSSLNMLELKLKRRDKHAHMLAYKQGIIHNPQKQWKSGICESVTVVYALKSHEWCYGMQTTQAKHVRGLNLQS